MEEPPCLTCTYKETHTIQEYPCSECCKFGVKGYPGYTPIPGLFQPEKFSL